MALCRGSTIELVSSASLLEVVAPAAVSTASGVMAALLGTGASSTVGSARGAVSAGPEAISAF
jgi:hypothetical protein